MLLVIFSIILIITYRSTIAIAPLARFIAKCAGLVVPEEDFGSDVEGIKPIFFDVGYDKKMLEEALTQSRKHLGDDVTILYSQKLPNSIKKTAKEQEDPGTATW